MLKSCPEVRRLVVCFLLALSLPLAQSAIAQPMPALSLRDLIWVLPRAPLGAHCVGNVVCTEMGTWGVHARLTGSMLIGDDRSVPGGLLTPAASFTIGGWGEVGGQFPILLGPLGTPPLPLPAVVFVKGALSPPQWIGRHGILYGSLSLPYGPFAAPDENGKPMAIRYEVGAAISGHLLWMLHYGMSISGQLSPGGAPPRLLTGLELVARFDGFDVFAQATQSAALCWGGSSDPACQSNVMVLGGLRIPIVLGHSSAAAGVIRGARDAEGTVVEATVGLTYDEATRAKYGDGIEKIKQFWLHLFNAVIDPFLDERCVLWDDDGKPMLDLGQRSRDGLYCERDGLRTPIHTHFDRDQESSRVCYDKGLRNCILHRRSDKDAWEVVPKSQQARRPYLKDDCHVYEEGQVLPLAALGIKSGDGQACDWEGHRFPIGQKFWALPDNNVMCQDATLTDCSLELPDKPLTTGQYVIGRSIERPVLKGAQKVLDAVERGAQKATDLATGELKVGTWGEQVLYTLKDAASHMNLEDARKFAKAAEEDAKEKAHRFAKEPLHEQLGDIGEAFGDGAITVLGNKGLGALGTAGSDAAGVTGAAEEFNKVVKVEKKIVNAERAAVQTVDETPGVSGLSRTGSALKSDPHHAFPNLVDNFARDAKRFEIPTRGPGGQIVRTSELFQVEGSLNGQPGVFEWIVDQDKISHRRFIPGGTVTGFPNQIPGK
jgi:hypothetical protein